MLQQQHRHHSTYFIGGLLEYWGGGGGGGNYPPFSLSANVSASIPFYAYGIKVKCTISFSTVQCTSSLFRCYDGRCVLGTHHCTGNNSCLDGSDEDGCRKYFMYTLRNQLQGTMLWRTDSDRKY